MSEREYTRLTRARRRLNGGVITVGSCFTSLWQGRDHLLCIDSSGFSEEYKRFYYRDIQAFVIRRDWRQLSTGLLLGLPLALFLLGAVVNYNASGSDGLFWVFLVMAIIFLIPFVYNLIAGATVKCYLQTAVQLEQLPPLNRLRRANKIINRLRPLIAATQGELLREEIPERMQAAQAESSAPTIGQPPLINP